MNGIAAIRDRNAARALFLATLAAGALALAAGLVFNYERALLFGIAIGCLPTGALGIGVLLWTPRWEARHPELVQRKADALDERSAQIRHQAGHAAFWVMFGYVFLYLILSPSQPMQQLSHRDFGVATICLMPLVYWAAVFAYSRKY